jgi:alanine dehydrogenase
MKVGTVRERKDGENRVGLTPEGAHALRAGSHEVLVEHGAGKGSGHSDAAYIASGATLAETPADVCQAVDLVVKVKEPVPSEFGFLSAGCALFTYLHLAADRPLTERLIESGCTSLAYELVRRPDWSLPLLATSSFR